MMNTTSTVGPSASAIYTQREIEGDRSIETDSDTYKTHVETCTHTDTNSYTHMHMHTPTVTHLFIH